MKPITTILLIMLLSCVITIIILNNNLNEAITIARKAIAIADSLVSNYKKLESEHSLTVEKYTKLKYETEILGGE